MDNLDAFRPTAGYHQLQHQRVMTGVLQPALGFPVSTEDIVEDAALDDPPVVSGAAITTGRASDALLTEEAECTTTFSGNFSTMARMASTPFCAAVNPPSLPHLPCSTIRPSLVDTQPFSEHSEDDRKADNPSDGYATFVQGSGSFMCTPNKVLSPIMEKSNESATSRASQSSGSEGGVGHHTIVGVSELSQIHEEPNTSRGNPDEPVTISTKHEGSVDLNPFSNEVQNLLVSRVQPAASSYEGFFQCERDLPRIAPGLAADLGKGFSNSTVLVGYHPQYITIQCHPYYTIPYNTNNTVPHHTTPYHTTLHHTMPHHTMPHHTIRHYTIPCHTIPHHTMPHHTIPYPCL